MKKILGILLVIIGFTAEAQVKISNLPAYSGAGDAGSVPVVIGGVNYKINGANLAKTRIDSAVTAISKTATLTTISGLRAMTAPSASAIYYTTDNPGNWKWNAASVVSDNTGTIIKATAVATGRFERIYKGMVELTWFGAVGDNSTNNTTAFNNAVSAMGGKGTLHVSDGIFQGYFSQTALDGFAIVGNGLNSVLKLPNATNKSLIKLLSSSNIIIRNLTLDGNKANNPTNETSDPGENNRNDNIYISKGKNIYIDNCYIHDARGNGVNTYRVLNGNTTYSEIAFNNAPDNDQNGITYQFAYTNETTAKDNGGSVSHCYIHDNPTGMGYSSFSAHGVTVSDCIFLRLEVAIGAEIGASKNVYTHNTIDSCDKVSVITGNVSDTSRHAFDNIFSENIATHINGSSTGFIQIASARNTKILNNRLSGTKIFPSSAGVDVQTSNNTQIIGNDIKGGQGNGINVYVASSQASNEVVAQNNHISNFGGSGIYIQNGTKHFIHGNIIFNDSTHGILIQSATKFVWSNNFIYDDQTVATQQYGAVIQDVTDVIESENTFSFNKFQPDVNLIGTNVRYQFSGRRNMARSSQSSSPSSTFAKGDKVFNSNPASGQPEYWVAITGGNPATFATGPILNSDSIFAIKQPLDADLTTIAGLAATTDNFMIGASSAWASRTPAQARTSIGLGSVVNADTSVYHTAILTALNARLPVASPTASGTLTVPNVSATTAVFSPQLNSNGAATRLSFFLSSTRFGLFEATTGDFILQNGGTFTSTGSRLQTASMSVGYVSKTGAYTAGAEDYIISGDATSGAFSITLPTAVGCVGRLYTIDKSDVSANAVTVATTSSQTINGSTTFSLATQYKTVTVYSNGANWRIKTNN